MKLPSYTFYRENVITIFRDDLAQTIQFTKLRIFRDDLAKSGTADFTILTEINYKIFKTFRIFRQSLLRFSQLVPL